MKAFWQSLEVRVSLPVREARNTDTIFVDKLIHKGRVTGEEKMLGVRV